MAIAAPISVSSGRLFENVGRYSALAQREREGQAPDPAADDRNSRL